MEFYELLEKLCDNGNSFVKYETVILGDFNTNVQNMSDVSPLLNSIKHFMQICGLKQLIEEPTRITATSESILDLIIVSDKDKIIQSGVLDIGLRPCPHDTFPNRARSIATSSRPVARVHTGATGTHVPVSRDHLATWNERARSIAIGCALSTLSCGRSTGR